MSSSPGSTVRTPAPSASSPGTADAQYMKRHNVAAVVERLLDTVVPSRHPRPFEAASLFSAPNPAAKAVKLKGSSSALTGSTTSEPSSPSSPKHKVDQALLDSLHFDVFTIDAAGPEGVDFVVNVFERYRDVLDDHGVAQSTVRTWAAAVQRNYRPAMAPADAGTTPEPIDLNDVVASRRAFDGDDNIPFHSFRHALNVLHTLHVYLSGFNARQHFDGLELLAMLVAALSHDVQHPGRDNGFLVATAHPLAQRYNDVAVLEQHHCAVAFAILNEPGCDLCSAFRFATPVRDGAPSGVVLSADFKRFRDCVVKCILGTEVASHEKHTGALASCFDGAPPFDPKANSDHRARLMVSLIQAADVSNEVRAFPFSRQWAPLVEEEFCRQGDAERALGMEVPQSRDRDAVSRGKEQTGFITHVCLPLFETLTKAVPAMEECVRNLKSNRDTWNALPS